MALGYSVTDDLISQPSFEALGSWIGSTGGVAVLTLPYATADAFDGSNVGRVQAPAGFTLGAFGHALGAQSAQAPLYYATRVRRKQAGASYVIAYVGDNAGSVLYGAVAVGLAPDLASNSDDVLYFHPQNDIGAGSQAIAKQGTVPDDDWLLLLWQARPGIALPTATIFLHVFPASGKYAGASEWLFDTTSVSKSPISLGIRELENGPGRPRFETSHKDDLSGILLRRREVSRDRDGLLRETDDRDQPNRDDLSQQGRGGRPRRFVEP